MQMICAEKKRFRMGGERFVMAVSIVFSLAFGRFADADRTISVFAGIDVLGKQTNKSVRVKPPAAFGPFREAMSLADEKGRMRGGRRRTRSRWFWFVPDD